ncbi:MAG: glycosyltransferase family 4 protein [Bacteroidetes bacterium]|nr:glycosyltransferase family 4 protein [Bacteroidota bacterium]
MHIVFFVNHFLPDVGGVQWSTLRTAEALVRRGHRVTVITETAAGEMDDDAFPFDIIRFRVPVRRPFTRFGYWRWMWRQRRMLATADVLHFHDYTPFFHWFLPLRALIHGPRYAVTFHGFEGSPIRLRHRFFRAVTARCCHVRFAVGDYLRHQYRHPIDAVYIGAPVRMMAPVTGGQDRKRSGLSFFYAGRLAEDTGILPFLECLHDCTGRTKTNAVVRIAGEGPLREAAEALVTEHLDIDFLGVRDDLTGLYKEADLVIATGFLGIFEAWSTGLPVLVPAFDELKRLYVASIPEAEDSLTIMTTVAQCRELILILLRGEGSTILSGRAHHAIGFVSQLRWDDIAVMYEAWYDPAQRIRPASQLAVIEARGETHAD